MTPPRGPKGAPPLILPSQAPVEASDPVIEPAAGHPPQESLAEFDLSNSYRLPPRIRPLIASIFNPNSQDGKIGREHPHYQRTMERAGFEVIPIETLPDKAARGLRIFSRMQELVTRAQAENRGPVIVSSYGGDGTFGEAVNQSMRAAGISLDPGRTPANASQMVEGLLVFFVPKKGKAADLAVQTGSPSRIAAMPKFHRRAIRVPFRFPTVEVSELPGEYKSAPHNFGVGESGFIFETREENYRRNPKNPLNRGVWSYLRLLPKAMANRYGLLGFDVLLRHYGPDGQLKQEATRRGSEVIVTPNRIMAFVGGVPGAWGETKMIILPPGLGGIAAVSEYIFRGVLTKFGFNMVGPRSRLRTLSAERQWLVQPGERIDVEIRVPDSMGWDVLRVLRRWNASFRGLFNPVPEIPAAGEFLKVPAQLNGDVVAPTSGFTVRDPGVTYEIFADPNALAVRLDRSSAFQGGKVPQISDQKMTESIPNHYPAVLEDTPENLRVRTPFVSQPRLLDLLKRNRLPSQRGIELLTALARVEERETLSRMGNRDLSIERAMEFLQTEPGQHWLHNHRGHFPALRERLLQGGVPLAAGIGGMIGGEALADVLGLDPVRNRELRFGLVVYLSHAVNANVAPLWEVAANRRLGRPYDFVRTRFVRGAGELFTQYTLESQSSLRGALGASWRSGALGIEAGVEQALWRRIGGLSALPIRAAWNMGEGLIFSRVTEQLVSSLPEDSVLRRYAPTAAYFLPDVGRLLTPGSTNRLLGTRGMRFASRAFAAGFIGDMAYTGLYRIAHGRRTTYEQWLNHRTAELRRERGEIGWFSLRSIPRIIAPSIADYIDSHDWIFGGDNSARQEMRREDGRQSSLLRDSIRADLPAVLHALNTTEEELFGLEIRLTHLEADMLQQLGDCRGGDLLPENAGFEETAAYLRRQYRGVVRTMEDSRRHLARIHAYQMQQSLVMLHAVDIPDNEVIRGLFDERGRLREGRSDALVRWAGMSTMPLQVAL